MDIIIYIVVIIAIIVRLVLMKGNFVLPTVYKRGDEMSFNLGSVSTIIIAIIAALGLMYTNPELFSSPLVAFLTAYTAPQLVDGVVTSVVRNTVEVEPETGGA
jgi:hypothetical protein